MDPDLAPFRRREGWSIADFEEFVKVGSKAAQQQETFVTASLNHLQQIVPATGLPVPVMQQQQQETATSNSS
jgi:hypothetical protein